MPPPKPEPVLPEEKPPAEENGSPSEPQLLLIDPTSVILSFANDSAKFHVHINNRPAKAAQIQSIGIEDRKQYMFKLAKSTRDPGTITVAPNPGAEDSITATTGTKLLDRRLQPAFSNIFPPANHACLHA